MNDDPPLSFSVEADELTSKVVTSLFARLDQQRITELAEQLRELFNGRHKIEITFVLSMVFARMLVAEDQAIRATLIFAFMSNLSLVLDLSESEGVTLQ